MKKNFLIFLIILLAYLGISFSGSIVITSPQANSVWLKGNIYTIKWKHLSKVYPRLITIILYNVKANKIEKTIAYRTTNTGSYRWKVPDKIPLGTYTILVKGIDIPVTTKSKIFKISTIYVYNPCRIFVSSPTGQKDYCKGDFVPIKWKYLNPIICKKPNSTINIKIMYLNDPDVCNYNFYSVPASTINAPDTGYYSWRISTMLFGGLYRVKMTKGNKVYYSNCFKVLVHCYLSEDVVNNIREKKFNSIVVKIPENYNINSTDKTEVDLREIIDFLTPIYHSDFDIFLTSKNSSKTLLTIFHSRLKWHVPYKGKNALVDTSFFGRTSTITTFWIEIYYNEKGELLNKVDILLKKI